MRDVDLLLGLFPVEEGGFVQVVECFGRRVAFEEIRSYHLGDSFDLAPAELDEFMRLAHEPDALASIEPMPGAAEALADWRQRGYQGFVITGRPPATREMTLGWLERHYGDG